MGADSSPADRVRLEASLSPRISLAFHQNAVPVLREVVIVNDGDEPMDDVEISVGSEPAFIKPRTWRVASVGGQQRYHLPELDIGLDAGLLGRLTEAEAARATFVLRCGTEETCRLDHPIELLARNQWGGIGHLPEMVAAFVQPNDPAVDRVLKKVADVLRAHGRDPALDGYGGKGRSRAWELVSATWSAVCGLWLDYALPPASFEHAGQKVRSPSQMLDGGVATCLDLTLLFAACLEQCGLNPVIVCTRGHAFAGCWLSPEEFASAVVDDVTALRKRVKLNELVLFETTLATRRPAPTFGQACERGAQHVAEAEEDKFELAVDLRRARMQRIRPLASTEAMVAPDQEGETAPGPEEPDFQVAPDFAEPEIRPEPDAAADRPQGRLDRWQRKLLDLSLRNNLLNFRASKRAIAFDAPDPGGLEDRLAQGHRLKIVPRPDVMDGADPRSAAVHDARHLEDARRAHALEAFARDEVLVALGQDDLEARLVDLFRTARANLQEGGANTLFLALGFLAWKRDDKEDRRYRAPLILIPVTLERKSVRSGFRLALHEDEPRFNPTLLEMLRQDFKLSISGVEGDLPKDDAGLDVAGIWRTVAQAVKDIKGWEVVEDVVLSTFSFAKYLMWKDLVERTDKLKQNPVVRHLMDTPRDPYPGTAPFPNPRELDATHEPAATFCPLAADSSQLAAVMAAARGKDFVLIGPPGTGKSQTIANLIAQCLAEGRTVLFVAEKIAALDVVYRRLRDVGLGDFCLELHSSKARKLDVLAQLRQAWDATGDVDAATWSREAERLKTLRADLNQFVRHLHRRHRNGLTAFAALGRVVAGEQIPAIGLSWPSTDAHDEAALDALRGLVDRLEINAGEVGSIAGHPLAVVATGDWSPSWQQSVVTAAQELLSAADRLEETGATLRQAIGLPDQPLDKRGRDGLAQAARALPEAAGRDWRFVLRPDARAVAEQLRDGRALLAKHRAVMTELSTPWHADIVEGLKRGLEGVARHREISGQLSTPYDGAGLASIDVVGLQADWVTAEKSWWPKSWFGRKAVRGAFAQVTAEPDKLDIAADLERLVTLRSLETGIAALDSVREPAAPVWAGLETDVQAVEAALAFQVALKAAHAGAPWEEERLSAVADGRCGAAMAADLRRMRELRHLEADVAAFADLAAKTNGLWAGLRTRIEEADKALAFHAALSSAIAGLGSDAERLGAIKGSLERLLGDGNALLEPSGSVAEAGRTYLADLARFDQAADAFTRWAGVTAEDVSTTLGDRPAEISAVCRRLLPAATKLRAWCAWRKARSEAIAAGLGPLVAAMEAGGLAMGSLRDVFETSYCRWWLNTMVDLDDVLRSFVPAEHERKIAEFKALDDRFADLTRSWVRARLCSGLPDQNDVSRTSEWGILRHEMEKKRRHIPLRSLIGALPTTLARLTPCMLMSPLSIAQYLSADTAMFDVVVFDEASQIPVWDAIGAMARGRQVVMVGDPKQLPPTSFFERAEADGDDGEDVEDDLESILDECLGANLPVQSLSWHYRSRHESLIAFSNHRYYGGGLVTFPSPVTEDRAVRFHHVSDGVYEKGGARINKAEARALVADLVGRLRDPDFGTRGHSIGVVTFNSEQQRLIEDLLDEERRSDPAIEPFFSDDRTEPVFVKNLESVQGDERDLIYFSITYGPDRSGHVSMNFGPMNRDGGERRLNVAVTRARHELCVFATLKPEQIDLSRTQAIGVRDFKHFLEFAQRGPRALAESVLGSVGDFDSPFEKAVAEALSRRGWRVHPQIGVSAFRIDLGVVDPDAEGRYLAGIECDGATYHRSATARDRDKLREQVLCGLGWAIVRIWSTEWWTDAAGALDKVDARLHELLKTARTVRAEESRRREEMAAARAAEMVIAAADFGSPADSEEPRVMTGMCETAAVFVGPPPSIGNTGDLFAGADIFQPLRPKALGDFREADPATVVTHIDADAFFEPAYDDTLRAMIHHVVEVEGPVRDDVLARRIAKAHGFQRAGARIRDRLVALAQSEFARSTEPVGEFLWPHGSTPGTWPAFRPPSSDSIRSLEEIALPELQALARTVRSRAADGEDAIQAMARAAGLQRLRAPSRERLEQAWAAETGCLTSAG